MNIAEILKDKPKGTRLYSPLFGECSLEHVKEHTTFSIAVTNNEYFTQSGQFFDIPAGECMLFPSKEMRDWQKFSWKKGEVLKYNNDNSYLIFEKFTDDSYTTFKWKHCINFDEDTVYSSEGIASTEDYSLANRCSCGFIHYLDVLEEKFHGKFKIDTMKFDKIEPTWKKGGILVNFNGNIECIFKEFIDDTHISFIGVHCLNSEENGMNYTPETIFSTDKFKLQDPKLIPCYINTIEERFNSKLNMETLELEKTQPEFKYGDIIVTDAVPLIYSKCILILKEDLNTGENSANSYVFYNINNDYINFNVLDTRIRDRNIHLATEEKAFFPFLYHEEISEKPIQYVHQLQHLLFGLGLDSNFNLKDIKKGDEKMTRKETNLRGIFNKPFGTIYRTRDSRKAVLVNTSDVINHHSELYVQESGIEDYGDHIYAPNGKCLDGDSYLDIIGLLN